MTYEPLLLEVEDNPNCEGVPQLIFSTRAEPREVTHVNTSRSGAGKSFHQVTGWCSDGDGTPCPAYAVAIEESGYGSGLLVYGGDWGIRLLEPGPDKADCDEPWSLESPRQWGETCLVVEGDEDVRYA